jgi:hypothetical protein
MQASIGACTNGLGRKRKRQGTCRFEVGRGYLLAIAATRTVRRAL